MTWLKILPCQDSGEKSKGKVFERFGHWSLKIKNVRIKSLYPCTVAVTVQKKVDHKTIKFFLYLFLLILFCPEQLR